MHSKKKRRWGRGSRDGGGVEGGMEEGKKREDGQTSIPLRGISPTTQTSLQTVKLS